MVFAVVIEDIGVNFIAGAGWIKPPNLTILAVMNRINLR